MDEKYENPSMDKWKVGKMKKKKEKKVKQTKV